MLYISYNNLNMNNQTIYNLIKNNYELPIIAWLNYNKIGANSEKTTQIAREIFWCAFDNEMTNEDFEYMRSYIDIKPFVFEEGNIWTKLTEYFETEKYTNFFKQIFQLTPNGLNTSPNACAGKGELLYRLLRPESTQPSSGDILDNGTKIEIKGNEVRMSSLNITGKNYKDITQELFRDYIVGNTISRGGLRNQVAYEVEKKQYKTHFTEQFANKNITTNIELFENLLTKLNVNGDIKSMCNKIFENNIYNQEYYQRILLNDFFNKYKNSMQFDKLFIMGTGDNIKIISTDEDLIKVHIYADYFRINQNGLIGWYIE